MPFLVYNCTIMKFIITIYMLFVSLLVFAQTQVETIDSANFILGEGVILSKTSFRGLSVVNDSVIWISGSRGTIAKSENGGKTFTFTQLKNYTKSDFRDIEAFNDKKAIMISSGTPAYILKTIDGGLTWDEVYKNIDSAYFLDAIDFWNEEKGIILGDPIKGYFYLLKTTNGGETWTKIDPKITPKAENGEAVYAASGTSLQCWGNNEFGFVSGGIYSSFYKFKNWNSKSIKTNLSIQQGSNSKGAYSLVKSKNGFFAVGGDYKNDSAVYKNFDEIGVSLYYEDMGCNPFGYRSCIEKITPTTYIACGTNGVDIFNHTKKHWKNINNQSFNVVQKAKRGGLIILAGNKGKIGRLIY